MGQNSEHRLPKLTEKHKMHIADCRAAGMPFEEIANYFREYFPDYAKHIDDDVFPQIFFKRLTRMFTASPTTAKLFLEAKQTGEIPVNLDVIPLTLPHVRLMAYQRLWDETPSKSIQRTVLTEDGEEIVYKYHTKERLAILVELRREMEALGILDQKRNPSDDFDDDDLVELVDGKTLWDEAEDAD